MFTGLPARMLCDEFHVLLHIHLVLLAGAAVGAAGLLVVPALAVRRVDDVQRLESAHLAGAVRADDVVVVLVRAAGLLAAKTKPRPPFGNSYITAK